MIYLLLLCSFDFYDDKLCLDSFKLDTVLGRHRLFTMYYFTMCITAWLYLLWLDLLGQARPGRRAGRSAHPASQPRVRRGRQQRCQQR